ncbi:MAG: metal ABC transporter substrate-binding protein [candidate division Zixibacteria bacterium]|nr:metal ABC transporter substrate-binding protein [candidate division Zixibacteria bacterium]
MKQLICVLLAIFLCPVMTMAEVNVVAATSDLACFAREIGGDEVTVTTIASPRSDVHFVEVKPSYMMKLRRADLVLRVGMDLDMWMQQLIDGSRNDHVKIVDCSRYISPLEVPTSKVDASRGDIHTMGNPHYWTTPVNVEPITDAIVEGLIAVDPDHTELYQLNQKRFLRTVTDAVNGLAEKLARLDDQPVIFYHNTWPYFTAFTGIRAVAFIEPYPGVPPTPSHVARLTEAVRKEHVRVIAIEPYFDRHTPDRIAAAGDAKVVTLYPSVGGRQDGETYADWLEGNITTLLEALQ